MSARGQPAPGASLSFGATVTIFFSDIRGFTEYTDQYGDETAYRILQQHNSLVRRQIELFGGQVVKTQGDSFMAAFRTARAAIQCAVAIQRALASGGADEQGTRIALGIGINTGEPIQEDGDFFGGPVNLASRICSSAGPGQILVSETTRNVSGRIEPVEFVDRGPHDLKGFQEPQRLYEVRWTSPDSRGGPANRDLQDELTGLTERCSQLGGELIEMSRAMQSETVLPPDTLGRQLAALRGAFVDLRARIIQRAGPIGVAVSPAAAAAVSLTDLEPVVRSILQTETDRTTAPRARAEPEDDKTRQAALEAAVQRAIGVLNRVLAIAHHDEAAFQPLLECQAKASELRLKLSRLASTSRDYPAQRVDESTVPFADLLALVVGREDVDDDRWMQLEETVGRAFGRQLAIAATRGRLVVEGVERRPARAPSRPADAVAPEPRPAPAAPAPPRPRAPEPEVTTSAPPRSPAAEPQVSAPFRAAEPAVQVPQPDPRAAAVPWWAAAHAAWAAWKASGVATAHALRAALARHPHLLSVPIRQSTKYDEGLLAEGYFLLIEHVENQSPAFVRTALDQALQQTGGSADPAALARALYDLLATKGKLRETYPDFLRDVMVAAIPNPGVWVDGALVENDASTVVATRPNAAIGETAERTQELTDPKDRYGKHRFAVVAGPLTTRFVCLKRGDLKEGRDIEVTVTEDGKPSDSALLLTLRSDHMLHTAPKRPGAQGALLEGLGRSYSGLWVALFNSEPEDDKRFEVVLSLRPQAAAAPVGRTMFGGPGRAR